jgi:ATP phosphoribosyltransferase
LIGAEARPRETAAASDTDRPCGPRIRVAVPADDELTEPSITLLQNAGYTQRVNNEDLLVVDPVNDVEFCYLQPRDIAVYVGTGDLDFGICGRDTLEDSGSPVRAAVPLDFGRTDLRIAVLRSSPCELADLNGMRIATCHPHLTRAFLARHRLDARIVKLSGDPEMALELGAADAITETVPVGHSPAGAGLRLVGDPIFHSEALLIERAPREDRVPRPESLPKRLNFVNRIRGVVAARNHVVISYTWEGPPTPRTARRPKDHEAGRYEAGMRRTPDIDGNAFSGGTVVVPAAQADQVIDELLAFGARPMLYGSPGILWGPA